MKYRKFSADKIFTGYEFLDDQQVLVMKEDGTVEAILPSTEAGEDIERHRGLLTPGLVNCHCHLELSHLKDVIPPHTGLIEFLCSVVTKRGFDPAIIQERIREAEQEMEQNGIVAVGDIGNTADTAAVKSTSRIYWQNFVEVLSLTDDKADDNIQHYRNVAEQLESALRSSDIVHRTSLVPHAPYTISPRTFQLINEATAGQVISIHNQEHPAEDELYKSGGGEYLRLFKIFGISESPFPVTGQSSIRSCLPYFNRGQRIFLVHNTYMPEEDIVWANQYAAENNIELVYCFCINANLYIENKVPVIDHFTQRNCPIVLGTDSYSSNWQLSIAREMQSFLKHCPQVPLETLFQWATINGARALQMDRILGSFEPGKKPGVTLCESNLSGSRKLM